MHTAKNVMVFFIGAVGYAMIEIMWRGFTHPTMILAGGLCFLTFSFVAEKMRKMPLLVKAFCAALAVTAVELSFGLIFNLGFGMEVWDYSKMPLNLFGQICPTFSLIWCCLGLIFIPIAEKINGLFI